MTPDPDAMTPDPDPMTPDSLFSGQVRSLTYVVMSKPLHGDKRSRLATLLMTVNLSEHISDFSYRFSEVKSVTRPI